MSSRIDGLIAAPYTPMRQDGSLHLPPISRLAGRLIEDGVKGVFVCGTTGEFASLTLEERMRTCEAWLESSTKSLLVIQHVGGTCIEDCIALARHASDARVDAIACIAPYFFKPTTVDELAEFCARVAGEAPELPFYYYHLPALSGVRLPMREFLRTASDRIPNLAGVKFSDTDLFDLGRCLELDGGRFELLFGCDEILIAGLAIGCTGAVGSTYSFVAPLYRDMIAAFRRGDHELARQLQGRAMALVELFVEFGGHRAMKEVLGFGGLDFGTVRAPLKPLDRDERRTLVARLIALGFGDLIAPADRHVEVSS